MGGSNLMSAIAGRVLLIPKGNYDSTATYTMLDMVVYNGSSYICKQECTGVVPTNTTYWMLNASGSAVAYINDIGDVVITNVSNGQVLMYDSTTQKWVNGTISTTLSGLTDTQIASLSNGQVLKYNATTQKWENADEKGGILPHLIVISETGSTVTATKGQTVITATETSTGHFECDLTEFGTWTIDAILGGDDAQVSLVVDTVKVYTVDDSHFHATVTVKYPSGATCRLQSADETLYATGSPYTFTVHHAETYTITVTYNQRIYTDTVTFTTEGQSFSKTLPSPSEVDANDLNLWLWFGDVSGTFSSLSEILANSTALSMLMSSTDAVDYLVRSTDWIINKGLVPIMTSDTTPSGVASAGNVYGSNNAYKAFDDDDTTYWYTNVTDSTSWIQYEFENPVCAKRFKALITLASANTNYCPSGYTLSASNDGVNFITLKTASITKVTSSFELDVSFENPNLFKYYRILVSNSSSGYGIGQWNRLQFYTDEKGITENQSAMSYIGLNNYCANTLLADADWFDGICNSEYFESVLNVKVPTMTGYSTPSGTVSASGVDSTYYPWKAFNNAPSTSTAWSSGSSKAGYIQYMFDRLVCITKLSIRATYGGQIRMGSFSIYASNDGSTWGNPIYSGSVTSGDVENFVFNNSTKYKYWRVSYSAYSSIVCVGYINFFGREDI